MSRDRLNVLITGCSPGSIGHALAKEYHSKGLRVTVSARRMEVLADLQELGMDAIRLDVTDPAAIIAAKEQVQQLTGGKLDILVNNAYVFPSFGLILVQRGKMTLFVVDDDQKTFDDLAGNVRIYILVLTWGKLLIKTTAF